MATILEKYGVRRAEAHVIKGLSAISSPHKVLSNELIGIEVEVENFLDVNGRLNPVWVLTEDGSLRNHGAELITRPIPASAAPVAMEYLFNHFLPQTCCFSPRTSVHVHLNMQDFTSTQLADLVALYVIFEKLFYRFTGRNRMKNIYCVPLADWPVALTAFSLRGNDGTDRWKKYTGLNTLPLSSHGTIEFRHMHGSRDVEKLTKWINLIVSLKEYVKKTPTATIRTAIHEMHDGYDFQKLLNDVFGEYAAYLKYESLRDINYLGAKLVMLANIGVKLSASSAFYNFKG